MAAFRWVVQRGRVRVGHLPREVGRRQGRRGVADRRRLQRPGCCDPRHPCSSLPGSGDGREAMSTPEIRELEEAIRIERQAIEELERRQEEALREWILKQELASLRQRRMSWGKKGAP